MPKIVILLFLMLFWLQPMPAQTRLDISNWLNTRLQPLESPVQSAANASFRPSWIEEVEIRTETEDFEWRKQEYLVRFRPSTPRIRRAQSRSINLSRQEIDLHRNDFRAEATHYLLEELLHIYYLQGRATLHDELLQLYRDEEKLLQKMLAEEKQSIKDVLEVEAKIQQLTLDKENDTYLLEQLAVRQNLPATEQLISMEKIALQLNAVNWTAIKSGDREDLLALSQIDAERELEEAEQNRLIDFAQVRYNGPHSDIWAERLAVSLAFELPYSASRKLKLEELEVEQATLREEVAQQKALDSLQIHTLLRTLRLNLDKRNRLQQLLTQRQKQYDQRLQSTADLAYESPESYLMQQKILLELRLELLDIATDIYDNYFKLLEESGLLQRIDDPAFLEGFILN